MARSARGRPAVANSSDASATDTVHGSSSWLVATGRDTSCVAARLERELSAVVNAAYGLTAEEEALIWRTAPPRMPIAPPSGVQHGPAGGDACDTPGGR